MTAFDKLSKEEQKAKMAELKQKLKKPPTKGETAWFDFARRNVGFEFVDLESGKIFSKLSFFWLMQGRDRNLVLASEDCLDGWKRRAKVGWTVIDIAGEKNAIQDSEIPTYKKR